MAGVLVALLVVVPLIEIYLLIQVGDVIGALPTVVLLIALSVLGAVLLKREGVKAWRAFQAAAAAGRVPTTEVADGALVLLGGALLVTPGVLTDAVGLLCVLPGTRRVVRRVLTLAVVRRFGLVGPLAAARAGRRGPRARDGVVEGERVRPPDDPTATQAGPRPERTEP